MIMRLWFDSMIYLQGAARRMGMSRIADMFEDVLFKAHYDAVLEFDYKQGAVVVDSPSFDSEGITSAELESQDRAFEEKLAAMSDDDAASFIDGIYAASDAATGRA